MTMTEDDIIEGLLLMSPSLDPSNKGFSYLVEAILYIQEVYKSEESLHMMLCYQTIADNHKVTCSSVERLLRNELHRAYTDISDNPIFYNVKGTGNLITRFFIHLLKEHKKREYKGSYEL